MKNKSSLMSSRWCLCVHPRTFEHLETSSPKEGAVPFARAMVNDTGTPPRRRNSDRPTEYSGIVAIMREQ
jgi:hypothetical protein